MTEISLDTNLFIVLTTESNYENAHKLAKALLESKLAACISLKELNSLYLWEGSIEEAKEVQLIVKTFKSNISSLFIEIKRLHSYKIPELISWPISSDQKYLDWFKRELSYS